MLNCSKLKSMGTIHYVLPIVFAYFPLSVVLPVLWQECKIAFDWFVCGKVCGVGNNKKVSGIRNIKYFKKKIFWIRRIVMSGLISITVRRLPRDVLKLGMQAALIQEVCIHKIYVLVMRKQYRASVEIWRLIRSKDSICIWWLCNISKNSETLNENESFCFT